MEKLYNFEESFEAALREYTGEETKTFFDEYGLNICNYATQTLNMKSFSNNNKATRHYYLFGYEIYISGLLYSDFYSNTSRIYNCENEDGKLFVAFVKTKHYDAIDGTFGGWKAEVTKVIQYGRNHGKQGVHCYPVFAGDHIEFYKAIQTFTKEKTDIFDCAYDPEFDDEPRYSTRFVWSNPVIEKIHEDIIVEF